MNSIWAARSRKPILSKPPGGCFLVAAVLALLTGCAHAPLNQPLAKYDPKGGYRYTPPPPEGTASDVTALLFFSGGGKRAAALAYGVLRELASTPSGPGGGPRRLLDDVEIISSVSGGSFPRLTTRCITTGFFPATRSAS